MLQVIDAQKLILNEISQSIETEILPLEQTLNRVLRREVIAGISVPPFDNSAMDGYLLHHQGYAPEKKYPLFQEIFAGSSLFSSIPEGQVSRIMTGAPIPPGEGYFIIPRERSQVHSHQGQEFITFDIPSEKTKMGQHVRDKGGDIKKDSVLFSPGKRLQDVDLALAASIGLNRLEVAKKPTVALISTGDELVNPPLPLKPGQIYNSNFFFLRAFFEELGAEVKVYQTLSDTLEGTTDFFNSVKEDILITCGGVSVGDKDYVREAFIKAGGKEIFWKVNLKPGKPLFFGRRGKQLLFGLPGNPVATVVTSELFLRPAFLKCLGQVHLFRQLFPFSLSFETSNPVDRPHVMRACLSSEEGHPLRVKPYHSQDSNVMSSVKGCEVFLFIPQGKVLIPKGETVPGIFRHLPETLNEPPVF